MDYFSLTDFLDPNPLRGMNQIYPSDRRDCACSRVLEPKSSDNELSAGDWTHTGSLSAIARIDPVHTS